MDFWVSSLIFALVVFPFCILRLKTNMPRGLWWLAFLAIALGAVTIVRYAQGLSPLAEATLWSWLRYVGAALLFDVFRLSVDKRQRETRG
jgi:hypothetical protein